MRLPGQLAAVKGKQQGQQHSHAQGEQLQAFFPAALQLIEQQGHAYVLTALERVRHGQKAAGGHQVTRISVHAGRVKVQLPADDGQQHHQQQPGHAQRCQGGGAVVNAVQQFAHGCRFYLR